MEIALQEYLIAYIFLQISLAIFLLEAAKIPPNSWTRKKTLIFIEKLIVKDWSEKPEPLWSTVLNARYLFIFCFIDSACRRYWNCENWMLNRLMTVFTFDAVVCCFALLCVNKTANKLSIPLPLIQIRTDNIIMLRNYTICHFPIQ